MLIFRWSDIVSYISAFLTKNGAWRATYMYLLAKILEAWLFHYVARYVRRSKNSFKLGGGVLDDASG